MSTYRTRDLLKQRRFICHDKRSPSVLILLHCKKNNDLIKGVGKHLNIIVVQYDWHLFLLKFLKSLLYKNIILMIAQISIKMNGIFIERNL